MLQLRLWPWQNIVVFSRQDTFQKFASCFFSLSLFEEAYFPLLFNFNTRTCYCAFDYVVVVAAAAATTTLTLILFHVPVAGYGIWNHEVCVLFFLRRNPSNFV